MKYSAPLLAVLLLAAGCGDDDDGPDAITEENLRGTWELVGYDATTETTVDGFTVSSEQALVDDDVTLTFNDDGTFVQEGSATVAVTVVTDGQRADAVNSELDFGSSGDYDVVDGRLTGFSQVEPDMPGVDPVVSSEESYELRGDELTALTSASVAMTEDGVAFAIDVSVEVTYRRQ